MTTMRPLFTLLALAAASLTTIACDPEADTCEAPDPVDAAAEGSLQVAPPVQLEPDSDAISLREQGPPAGLYLSAWGGKPINRAVAKAIVDACKSQVDPPQTCTLSWYQPDTSDPTRVLGLGCSMIASWPLWDCYRKAFEAQKATPF